MSSYNSHKPVSFNGRNAGTVHAHYVETDVSKNKSKVNSASVGAKKAERMDARLKTFYWGLLICVALVVLGHIAGARSLQWAAVVGAVFAAFAIKVRSTQIETLRARAGLPAQQS